MSDRVLLIHDPEESHASIAALAVEAGYEPLPLEQIEDPALKDLCQRDSRCIVLRISNLTNFVGLMQVFREIPDAHRPYSIVISPATDLARHEEYLAAGADDFIVSPLNEGMLRTRLQPAKRFLQMQRAYRRQSFNDPLTGTLNRTAVLDMLERELKRSRRLGYPVAVVMVDVDLLKQVNDTQGHLAGDTVMASIANRIASQLRPYDAIGRYGGDEFLIVLSNCNGPQAVEVCQRIRSAVSGTQISTPIVSCKISVSLGVAAAEPKGVASLQNLILQADNALYEAKRAGRDRVVIGTYAPPCPQM